MFLWLSNLPVWFQIVFVILLVILVSIIAYLMLMRGLRVQTNGGTVGLFFKKNSQPNGKRNPHKACPYTKDIVILLHDTIQIITTKLEIKLYQTVRRQMNMAEEIADSLIADLESIYLKLLKSKGIDSTITDINYQAYKLVLEVLKDKMLSQIRRTFREDDLVTADEDEFRRYIDTKTTAYIGKCSAILNELYFYNDKISREELYTENIKHLDKFESNFNDVFYFARKVAIEHNKLLEELDAQLDDKMKPFHNTKC